MGAGLVAPSAWLPMSTSSTPLASARLLARSLATSGWEPQSWPRKKAISAFSRARFALLLPTCRRKPIEQVEAGARASAKAAQTSRALSLSLQLSPTRAALTINRARAFLGSPSERTSANWPPTGLGSCCLPKARNDRWESNRLETMESCSPAGPINRWPRFVTGRPAEGSGGRLQKAPQIDAGGHHSAGLHFWTRANRLSCS